MSRYLLLLWWAFATALPVRAEGGSMYPSEGAIAFLVLAFGVGIPLVLAGLAIGLAKLLRPAAQRLGPVFWAAWVPWVMGMMALLFGLSLGMSEDRAFVCCGLLSFAAALLVALRTGQRPAEKML